MLTLNRNLPVGERVLRIACGATLVPIVLAVASPGPWRIAGLVVAAAVILSGALGSRPACAVFGRGSVGRSR